MLFRQLNALQSVLSLHCEAQRSRPMVPVPVTASDTFRIEPTVSRNRVCDHAKQINGSVIHRIRGGGGCGSCGRRFCDSVINFEMSVRVLVLVLVMVVKYVVARVDFVVAVETALALVLVLMFVAVWLKWMWQWSSKLKKSR
jgi:hypothetical protein